MSELGWDDGGPLPVRALMDHEVEGQPWPVLVLQGNVHYLEGGTDEEHLRCLPIYRGHVCNSSDAGGVDYDMIEPELGDICRAVIEVLRCQAIYEEVYVK